MVSLPEGRLYNALSLIVLGCYTLVFFLLLAAKRRMSPVRERKTGVTVPVEIGGNLSHIWACHDCPGGQSAGSVRVFYPERFHLHSAGLPIEGNNDSRVGDDEVSPYSQSLPRFLSRLKDGISL